MSVDGGCAVGSANLVTASCWEVNCCSGWKVDRDRRRSEFGMTRLLE
jgi:hypothetical protein